MEKLPLMELNEIGDFCAGIFGPITFFWMVIGFIMQTQELKQSSKSLQLQAEELANSVQQQADMVNLTREQFILSLEKDELDKEIMFKKSQPIFDFISFDEFNNLNGAKVYTFILRNSGHSITGVNLSSSSHPECVIRPQIQNAWDNNVPLKCFIKSNKNINSTVILDVKFIDGQRNLQSQILAVSIVDNVVIGVSIIEG